MTITKVDWDIIDARVSEVVQRENLSTSSKGLLWLALEQIFPSFQAESLETITDGPNDKGVDALHIIESHETAEVFIFQAKYRDNVKTTNKTINDSEILRISLFLDDVFNQNDDLLSCNLPLAESVKRIWEIHKAGKICRYHIFFCSNDAGLSASARTILNNYCDNHQQVTFEFYGPKEFIRDLSLKGRIVANGNLQVVGKEVFERSDGDVRGVVASVDALSYISLICDDNSKTIKRHVFDDNLRIFLGAKGGYNASIISTATSDHSHLFWYLNNGITITCKKYSYNKGHTNPTIKIDDFQIVNGAQTSHSLLEAARQNATALEDVVVMVRIYATDRNDITEKVAVATNSQAKIQSRDLRANHAVLKKLELAFEQKGYFFERKKNMHSQRSLAVRIDALKLGQVIQSFYLREPDRARTASDDIFDAQFQTVFHERYEIEELCKVWELYREIDKLRDEYTDKYGTYDERENLHRFLVYGQWFVLYTCGLLISRSDNRTISNFKSEDVIEEAIAIVAAACGGGKRVSHYQIFRSSKTKEKILAELSGKQPDFFHLFKAG